MVERRLYNGKTGGNLKNNMLLFLVCFVSWAQGSDDYRRQDTPREIAAGRTALPLAMPINNNVLPMSIFQRSENYIECVTKTGERLRFKVKLTVDVKPMQNQALVKMDIFQGNRLITSRNLDFFW